MNDWIESFSFSIAGAALLLSVIGLWFTTVIPGIDRWSKRFFVSYFIIFMLCCLSSIVESVSQHFIVSGAVFYFLMLLESLLLSLPLPMLTVFLLHCCGENTRKSKLLYTVLGVWAVYFIVSASSAFVDGFFYLTPENQFNRGPLYPLFLLPVITIQVLNLAGTIKRRKQLSCKAFSAFLVAILPIMIALIAHLFIDVFPLIDISHVCSALALYSLILSDQIEQDRRRQNEIVRQKQEIAMQQQRIAHERASVMVLQMRPHFIYNTLMSIHSLCRLDPMKAQQVTMDFTNYLRKNFNAVASDSTIPFSTELEHTRAYLAVEQAQYDDMLVVDYDMPFINFRLPPLTLQPIVENAVKHGMDPYSGALRISIRTRHTDSGAEVVVEDNGRGFAPADDSTRGIALENIRQRLELMCDGRLDIIPKDGKGTVVTVTIPDSAA